MHETRPGQDLAATLETPGFYAGGRSVQRLVDFVAGKALDALGVEHTLLRRWGGQLGEMREAP